MTKTWRDHQELWSLAADVHNVLFGLYLKGEISSSAMQAAKEPTTSHCLSAEGGQENVSEKPKAINPEHYVQMDPQPITVIEDWGLGFNLGNAVAYIARAGKKGSRKDDLLKAANYCFREATGKWLPEWVVKEEQDDTDRTAG